MKYLIFELFTGVGFCNQLFSFESAIYLSNITNRKLILIIKNPLCHCGKCDWNYGKFINFFSYKYLQYLRYGIDIYYKEVSNEILEIKKKSHNFSKEKFSEVIFIDKDLNTDENKDDIEHFANGRNIIEIDYNELDTHLYLYIENDISNASRCFYNFYTNIKNLIIMNRICASLNKYNIEIENKIKLIDIKYNYNAIHFRFGDYHIKTENIIKDNELFFKKIYSEFTDTSIPIFVMCDRKDNEILNILKKKYTIFFTDEFILNIHEIKNIHYPIENFILEKSICENAATFLGTDTSTVSNYINYTRYLNNKNYDTYLKKTFYIKSIGDYSWNDNLINGHVISWAWFFNDNVLKCNDTTYLKIVKCFNMKNIKNKKIISFSIYDIGKERDINRGFYKGIFVNYELAQTIYPDWIIRVYLPYDEPITYINRLIQFKNIEVILVNTNICLRAIRYLPYDDPNVNIWISRDLDSVVNYREKAAVDEWLENYSDKELHIMSDNDQHTWTIAAGMFGFKNNHLKNLSDFMLEFCRGKSSYNYDDDALIAESFFYNPNNYIQHYSSGKKLENSIPFPNHKLSIISKFVGDIVNIDKYYDELEINKNSDYII